MSDRPNPSVQAAAAAAAPAGLLRLKLVVFFAGAVLMSLEMAGVRVLNVYFGSTIYIWGAIIGIFLGALSLGYYIGGMAADRWPRLGVLGLILFTASIFIFPIPWLAGPLCEALGRVEGLGPRLQALFGSVALYFIPSVACGMVSPFAVRLAAHGLGDLGRVAGRLYALSTLGSIAGTFVTSFVLIEFLGLRMILLLLGAVLLACAIASLVRTGSRATALVAGGLLLAGSWYLSEPPATMTLSRGTYDVLERVDSAHHNITIVEGPSWYPGNDDHRARFVIFNDQAQSGMELEGPGRRERVHTACGYTDMLHLGMIFREAAPRRALIVGCGGGVGPMVFWQDYPGLERLDVVDIDPEVFRLAEKYFRYRQGGSAEVLRDHIEDGRLFLRKSADAAYDYIVLDAYSAGGMIPFHLVTQEFMQEVRRCLAPEGVMVINVISAVARPETEWSRLSETERQRGALHRAVARTLRTVFPQVYVFPRYRHAETPVNIVMVCTLEKERLTPRQVRRRLELREGRLIKRETLELFVANLVEEAPAFARAPLLTDNYCPTDSMVAP